LVEERASDRDDEGTREREKKAPYLLREETFIM
jgi:hypothetical protein